jgi:hypothetical protein
MYHSGYGFNPDMGHGQYSPMATPLTPIMLDGQLYSPQQIPFSPVYHPDVPSPGPLGSSEQISFESNSGNSFFGPGSGYLVHYGSFGGGNMSGAPGSDSLTSPSAYPQPMGILGPYEHQVAQVCFILFQLLWNLEFPKVSIPFSHSHLLPVFLAHHHCFFNFFWIGAQVSKSKKSPFEFIILTFIKSCDVNFVLDLDTLLLEVVNLPV